MIDVIYMYSDNKISRILTNQTIFHGPFDLLSLDSEQF